MNVKDNIVPCGKCFECKRNDRNSWALRIMHEIKKGTFITLTYDEEHLPENGKLRKKDLQDYIKRVREQTRNNGDKNKLIFFACGEYGTRYGRPHYHIIVNNTDNALLKSKWDKGITYFGKVEEASILYVTKYIQKQNRYKKDQEKQQPKEFAEFRLMSKGIGNKWLNQYSEYVRKNLITFTAVRGIKYPLPRYYRNKIFNVQTKTSINKETGEIITTIIQDKIDLREVQDANKKRKIEKLVQLYGNLLLSERNPQYEKYYKKYQAMLNKLNLKQL